MTADGTSSWTAISRGRRRRTKHQTVSLNRTLALATYLRNRPLGRLFVAPFDVVLSDLDVVEPDLVYIAKEHNARVTDQNVRGTADLVVEIVSPGTRRTDEVVKRKLYERFGVAEYWVVDPELDAIKIYRRVGGAFERTAELSVEQAGTLSTPLLPEFSVTLARIFAAAP